MRLFRKFVAGICKRPQHTAFLVLLAGMLSPGPGLASEFEDAVNALNTKKFSDKEQAVYALSEIEKPRTITVLQAMLDGQLYYRKSDQRIVIAVPAGDDYALTDAVNAKPLGTLTKRAIKKINTNNRLRSRLRSLIASLSLGHPDRAIRLGAIKEMLGDVTPDTTPQLRRALDKEQDEKLRTLLQTGLWLGALESEDRATQLAAIAGLDGSILPAARNRLGALAEASDDEEIKTAAQAALRSGDAMLELNGFLETVFFGLSLGSVLLLAAIGLAITFGVMGVINMAHGELIMIGAYTTYLVQMAMPGYLEWSILVAIPAAFLVSGLFGIAIERSAIRFLYGRPLETLLATFGISLILQQLVRTTISAQNVVVSNPAWMSGSLEINPALSLTYNRIYILVFALLVFFALLALLKKTSLGLQVRAVAQNRPMAKAMGIRSDRVDALTFGLGSGIAGVAGVALSQLTNVGPNMGQSYIIDSFMVVVFGGVANLWGTLVGAMSLGVANKFLEPFTGAVLAKILVLVFIILFIQKRPRGLFPQKGRSAEH